MSTRSLKVAKYISAQNSSLKSTGKYKGSKAPWPPLRIPGPIHAAYTGLRRLLHCRTMHSLIFTILYKVEKVNFSLTILGIMRERERERERESSNHLKIHMVTIWYVD